MSQSLVASGRIWTATLFAFHCVPQTYVLFLSISYHDIMSSSSHSIHSRDGMFRKYDMVSLY